MSSRALRRLLKERGELDEIEMAKTKHSPEKILSGESDDGAGATSPVIAKASMFAALCSEEEELAERDDEPTASTDCPIDGPEEAADNESAATDAEQDESATDDEDKLLNKMLAELELTKTHSADSSSGSMQPAAAQSIFQVDVNWLDPSLELHRKLGTSGGAAADLVADQEALLRNSNVPGSVARQFRGRGGSRGRALQHRSRTGKRQLVAVRPLWTKVTSALVELRLERIREPTVPTALYSSYRLVPSSKYQEQFEQFATIVEAGDIQLMYSFAHRHPLHVDALLTVSDFLRMSSAADASELTERAIYIMEKSLLATTEMGVDLTSGAVRFPYDGEPDNRRLHLALFRYIQFLLRKGCYRTAMEFCKILLSLDPDADPLAVHLVVDFAALQAGQFEWFGRLRTYYGHRWRWLGTWDYSSALALLIKSGDSRSADQAERQLVEAILAHPWIIPQLASAAGLPLDEDSWRNCFDIALPPVDDYLGAVREAIGKIYAARSGPIWKQANIVGHLESAIATALSIRLGRMEADKTMSAKSTEDRPSPLNALAILRHSTISDLKNVAVSIPASLSSGNIRVFDPLPPEEAEILLEGDLDRGSKCCIN